MKSQMLSDAISSSDSKLLALKTKNLFLELSSEGGRENAFHCGPGFQLLSRGFHQEKALHE
jgi:hypothetical protein